jgi:formyltetrahydrofolate-dependent phosphoribosylglycinamide formyltransferase
MFKRLQEKWGVSIRQFWIIFIVFGLTGTTTAILTRYITAWLGMNADTYWAWKLLLRVAMLVLGYQFILLGYGALLGQWSFFWKYERKLLRKLGVWSSKSGVEGGRLFIAENKNPVRTQERQTPNTKHQTKKIVIFASGAGSNAEKIIAHLKNHSSIEVSLVVCNKPEAGVLAVAAANGIPSVIIEKERFFRGDAYVPVLKEMGIDLVVLAGFLWKIPAALIEAYPQKIINIHPALLPKYGGKGMYGMRVHESVIGAGDKESGITIHYVNEHFDEGTLIFQARCKVDEQETPESLAQKIHALEHAHFPEVIEKLILSS